MTLPAVLTDVRRPPGVGADECWLATYVMVSRATSLEGLLLVGEPDWDVLDAGPPTQLIAELDRLAGLARLTTAKIVRCRAVREGVVPATAASAPAHPQALTRSQQSTLTDIEAAAGSGRASTSLPLAPLRALLRGIGAAALGFADLEWLRSLDAARCERLVRIYAEARAAAPRPAPAPGRMRLLKTPISC